MQAGDIVLVQGHGLLSESIEFLSQGSFSHAALATSEDAIIEAGPDGVVEVPMHYDHYAVFRVTGITDEKCTEVVAYARNALVGEGYDYTQDLGFAVNAILKLAGSERIPNLFDEKRKLVCSAAVDVAFRGVNIILRPDKLPGDVTPTGLSYSLLICMIENHNLWEI